MSLQRRIVLDRHVCDFFCSYLFVWLARVVVSSVAERRRWCRCRCCCWWWVSRLLAGFLVSCISYRTVKLYEYLVYFCSGFYLLLLLLLLLWFSIGYCLAFVFPAARFLSTPPSGLRPRYEPGTERRFFVLVDWLTPRLLRRTPPVL